MTKHGGKVDSKLGFQKCMFSFLKYYKWQFQIFYNVQYIATTMYYCVSIIMLKKKKLKNPIVNECCIKVLLNPLSIYGQLSIL